MDSAQPPLTEGAGINHIALAHFPCQCSPFTHENSWLTLSPTGSHPVIRRIKAQGSKQVSCAVPTLLIVKERYDMASAVQRRAVWVVIGFGLFAVDM
ncbi:hypothetical protein TUM17567_31890 [Citrobacter amalonaticus]|nr:hypothetical protein TUM17567_31890 [Citrobacter amalonaticus]